MLDDIYQELILDHYRHPRHRGVIEDATASKSLLNPLCGDCIKVAIKVADGKLADISFDGQGCSISQASASLMCELIYHKSLADVDELLKLFFGMIKGTITHPEIDKLQDVTSLEGVRRVSSRIRCAALSWEALSKCLSESCATKPS